MLSPTATTSSPGSDPGSAATVVDAGAAVRDGAHKRIESHRLLSNGRELVIEHAGQEYRLRLTRNDKLILTK